MTYNLIGTSATNYNGCYPYSTCTSNKYTTYDTTLTTNVKTRLLTNQEAISAGCTGSSNSCPTWMVENTDGNGDNTNYGYWISNAYASMSSAA